MVVLPGDTNSVWNKHVLALRGRRHTGWWVWVKAYAHIFQQSIELEVYGSDGERFRLGNLPLFLPSWTKSGIHSTQTGAGNKYFWPRESYFFFSAAFFLSAAERPASDRSHGCSCTCTSFMAQPMPDARVLLQSFWDLKAMEIPWSAAKGRAHRRRTLVFGSALSNLNSMSHTTKAPRTPSGDSPWLITICPWGERSLQGV